MNNDSGPGNLKLEEYNSRTPPGWRQGVPRYPYRLYMQKLRLWWRMTDLTEQQAGAAVASRLHGTPFQIAMRLRITREGVEYVGDDALILPR